MDVCCTRFVDEDEENSPPEFFYEFDVYRFSEGGLAYVARSYTDTPAEARFTGAGEKGTDRRLTPADLRHPLLRAGADFLRAEGKHTLTWFDVARGYVPIDEAPSRTA